MTETTQTSDTLYCANHPEVATALRCNRCGKPICSRCAVRTPVGYRCRECLRSQQQVFETAVWYDFVVAGAVGLFLGLLSTFLLSLLGFFALLLAPVAGGITAEVIRAAVRRRRGRYLPALAAGTFAVGSLVWSVTQVLAALAAGGLTVGGMRLLGLLIPLFFTVLASSTLYMRLRGITL